MRDWGAHQLDDMTKDLSGAFVLLSNHFYYFGSQPVPIPSHLLKIVNQRPGHKKDLKKPYVEKFIEWITEFNEYKNKISAPPFGLLPQ
jgi:CRISPR/Cas system CSM-associated protein Csm4 (group 5 of RAMP superfamily)